MSLLTFKRMGSTGDVSIVDFIRSINRQLERQFPDCTCSVQVAADTGMASESVTVELEITHESLACLDWYRKQAEARGLLLIDWKPRQGTALESDVTAAFLSPHTAW